jgi:hypothetical protein
VHISWQMLKGGECLASVVVYCVMNRSLLEQLYVWYCTNKLYKRTVCKVFALPYRHTFPFFYIVPLLLYTPHFSTFSPFLTLWSTHFTIPRTSHLSVRKPSIQFLFTAHVYSDEHTVVVILLIKFRNGTNRSPLFPLFLIWFKYKVDHISVSFLKTIDMIW